MPASSLGYVVVEATNLTSWHNFAVDTLGLMAGAENADGGLRLRVDERPFRILVLPETRTGSSRPAGNFQTGSSSRPVSRACVRLT